MNKTVNELNQYHVANGYEIELALDDDPDMSLAEFLSGCFTFQAPDRGAGLSQAAKRAHAPQVSVLFENGIRIIEFTMCRVLGRGYVPDPIEMAAAETRTAWFVGERHREGRAQRAR
ncbi:hypothetical protein LZC95_19645 [Pendulispora brunnea]|uniref:Uncharacterized protein n=1 Tax=Pendulispora brunnea TaxID=2905690 RepID=A0ABZ2KMW8_9BACT